MTKVGRNGFTLLGGSTGVRDVPHRVNIIFVHGLRGHPRFTWETNRAATSNDAESTTSRGRAASKLPAFKSLFTSKQSPSASDEKGGEPSAKVFWPEDYLVEDMPEARVWTYGYNADVIGGLFKANNKNSVSQHGRDLARRLERELGNEYPIIFVAHSLGGIIVKDALHRSEKCRQRTRLIVFLGTPHRGSGSAGWGEIASNLARLALQDSNKKIIKTLEANSEVLDIIHEEFIALIYEQHIKVYSFQEARGIAGMKGLDNKVVDDFSSKLDLPRQFETIESIDANHMQMARCDNRDDLRYRTFLGVLSQFMRNDMLDRDEAGAETRVPIAYPVGTQQTTVADRLDGSRDARTASSCYSIPFRENTKFVGRDKLLDSLKQKFFHQNLRKLALVGLGGIGKTQVALNFAYWVRQIKPEYSIFWVPALSGAAFEQAYDAIAKKLPAQVRDKDEDPKRVVQRYLSSGMIGSWLLVVDNADDEDIFFGPSTVPGGLYDFLPEREGGLILFTTRSRKLAVETEADIIDIPEMDSDEAIGLLRKWLPQEQLMDATAVRKLLEELTYLPLAITQAAAYLKTTQVSIADYLQLLRGTEKDMVNLLSREFRDGNRYAGSHNAVATTWLVSFEQIRRYDPTAADLLAFISCIEPKAIPRSLFPSPESEETVYAIGTLRGYAFLVSQEDSVFDMHNLVHLATRSWVAKQGFAAQTKETTIRHLEEIFPSDDFANRNLWREYLPHALKVLQESEDLDMKEAADLYYWVGRCLKVDGRIKAAVACLTKCCLWRESHFSDKTHPSRLASQHTLAQAYEANGQVKEAIGLLEHLVKIQEITLDKTHPDRLASQHTLAQAYEANGQVKEAIGLLEHVVKIEEITLDETHPSRLVSQHALAEAYETNGQMKEAIGLLEHVVKIREITLDETHPDRLASQHAFARAYEANEQVKKVKLQKAE